MKMLGSRKYAHLPHGGTVEFSRGVAGPNQTILFGGGDRAHYHNPMAIRSTFLGGEGEELR